MKHTIHTRRWLGRASVGATALVLGLAATLAQAQAPAATTTVSNPYGLDALWAGGDFVAKGTLGILAVMSIGSWFIIVTKLFEQFKLFRQGAKANKTFWDAGEVAQGLETLDPNGAFHFLAKAGVDATTHHNGLRGYVALNDWIVLSIQRAIDSPSPVPSPCGLVVKKGSKILARVCSDMPRPSSCTSTHTHFASAPLRI